MFVVMTRVKLKPGTINDCAQLFRETNPKLVEGEPDWHGAQMMYDTESRVVTVLANWANAASYQAMTAKPHFQSTMSEFAKFFDCSPEISTNELLVEMTPLSLN